MPYIKPEDRPALDQAIAPLVEALVTAYPTTEKVLGPLNYTHTRVAMGVLRKIVEKDPSQRGYASLAGFAGVLSHIGTEVYRRFTAVYEDTKIASNGDVPEFEP